MPKVSINHKCTLSAQEAYTKIKTFFESDPDIRRFDPNLKCEYTDSKMTGKAIGSKFKADIAVTGQGESSIINVIVDLPLLLSPFKGKIQETIERKLSKYLV